MNPEVRRPNVSPAAVLYLDRRQDASSAVSSRPGFDTQGVAEGTRLLFQRISAGARVSIERRELLSTPCKWKRGRPTSPRLDSRKLVASGARTQNMFSSRHSCVSQQFVYGHIRSFASFQLPSDEGGNGHGPGFCRCEFMAAMTVPARQRLQRLLLRSGSGKRPALISS